MTEYKLNSNLVTRSNIDKTDNIKNNNFNTPWKIFTTHICHDPDSYGNINYYNQNEEIEFNNLDASNNNLYIENKKNDTIISVNENKKIKFEGITEFSNNSFFYGNITCNSILDISSIYTYSISSEIIKANEIEGDITFKGNVTIDGIFSKSGEESSTLNLFNSNIIGSNIVNSKIGISKTGEIERENAYIDFLNTNDISINNDLLINNNIFLKNIENSNFNYINLESILTDTSFNLKYNNINNNILINNIEYNDSNKFYIEKTNYLFNNNLEYEYNFAIYIKNTNYANITTTDSNIFTENYNSKNYTIIINNSSNLNLYKEFNLNITGNFEYIDIIIFEGNNLNDGIIIKTFENIFLYKHDIDLINKLNVIDESLNRLNINNFSNNTEFFNVSIKNTLNVTENTTLYNSLEVHKNSILQELSAGATDISSSLNVSGTTILNNTLTVTNKSTLQDLSAGITDISSTLNVSGAVTLNNTLDVSGDTSVSTFDSTGATSLATNGGEVNIASSGQMTTVKGTLNVDEAVTLDTTLDVTGDTSVTTFDSTGATSLATGSGAVNIASSGQMTTIKGTLNVDEAVTLDTTLDVSGDTSVSTFDSTGATSLATGGGAVNIASSGQMTNVKGTLNVDEAVTLDTTLDVTGDTSVSTFDSTGATSLATGGGSVNIASLEATTTIKGTLNVNQAVTCDTTLSVSKNNNTTHYLGKAKIGYIGSDYDNFAGFCHHDLNNSSYALLQNSDGETSLNSATGKNLNFRINNNPKMTLDSNGNVGIGITNPSTLLHVNGNATINGSLSMQLNSITNVDTLQVNKFDVNGYYGTTNQVLISNGSGNPVSWANQIDTTYSAGTGVSIDSNNNNKISIGQPVGTGNTVTFSEIYTNNWFRVNGSKGIYWQNRGGGWYMDDNTWIKMYNSKSLLVESSQSVAAQFKCSAYTGTPSMYKVMRLVSPNGWWGIYINNASSSAIRGTSSEQNGDLIFTYQDSISYNEFENGGYYLDANWNGGDGLDFTGQHRSLSNKNINAQHYGLIVVSSGKYINLNNSLKPTINESLCVVELCKENNSKNVYGVLSNKEDNNENFRTYKTGGLGQKMKKSNINDDRIIINSLGEGAIWVSNKNGNLNNGDYITTSSLMGYGMKQNENILYNFTVAKITCECDFNLIKKPKQKIKQIKIENILKKYQTEIVKKSETKEEIIFDEITNTYVRKKIITEREEEVELYDEYDLYDESGNILEEKHKVYKFIEEIHYNYEITYDENGDILYENDLDDNGNIQYEYDYETRFLDEHTNILSGEEEYLSRLNNGENVYIACFVGCTYHCG